jgi:uncharacterized protein (TIGR02147 family)
MKINNESSFGRHFVLTLVMSIYQFTDYRAFLNDHFKKQERGGRGQLSKLAQLLDVHSTFISLVFKNKRDLSLEQGLLVAQYLKLTDPEIEYFLNLIQLARAGHHELKRFIAQKIKLAQAAAKRLGTRFEHERQLGAEERQIFYSSWHYSAIRIYTSTHPSGRTAEEICAYFKLSRKIVMSALHFLKQSQLIIEKKDHYFVGPQRTFLEKDHPMIKCHHTNWRQKALNQFEELTDDEMMFTTTLSLSRNDFNAIREHLAQVVKKTSDIMKETNPEEIVCLGIDFFVVR